MFSQDAASFGASFLRVGQSAKQLALGNSGRADLNNDALFFYNASALVYNSDKKLSMNILLLSQDRSIYSLSFQSKLKDKVGFSLAWIYATVGELYSYDLNGNQGDEINYSDQALLSSFGLKVIDNLSFGVSVKYLFSKIGGFSNQDYSSKGLNIDFSFSYLINEKHTLAFIAKEFIGSLSSNSEQLFEFTHKEKLIKQWILSYAAKSIFINELNLYSDFQYLDKSLSKIHLGVEYFLHPDFPARIGYNNGQFTGGFGISFEILQNNIDLNYAFLISDVDDGDSHVISWQIRL